MTRQRLRIALAATTALVAAAGVLATVNPAQAAGTMTATFSLTSDWGSGWQGAYTIANGGISTVSTWTVRFDLPAGTTLSSSWDTVATQSGVHVTAANKSYNAPLAPGASATFGLIATGAGKPTNCTLNNVICAGIIDNTAPTVPGTLRSTAVTSSSVSLAWTASTDNIGVSSYEILRGGVVAATVTGTSGTVAGLNPSTAYAFTVRAVDGSGNRSAASNQVSATTSTGTPPGTGPTLPVAPYVDMGAFPTPVLTDMATGGNLRNFTLAFITANGCRASWFNAFDPRTAWSKDQIDAIRARGGDVKISFGGASGLELAQSCTSAALTAAEYLAVINAYSATYIDFDIEGGAVVDAASVTRRSQALAMVQAARPNVRISLTLPVLPEGLTADGLNVVRSARDAGVNLDLVNVMAMDYQRPTGNYGTFAVQAGQSTVNQLRTLYPAKTTAQLWRMVGVTPMLGQNDDGGIFTLAGAQQLVSSAQTNHMGMLSYWEETRDRNACTGALFMCTNVTQTPYQYSRIFAAFTG
jgi:hypothetical protein